MNVHQFRLETNEANAFLLGCDDTRDALLVDAGEYPEELDAKLAETGFTLKAVFITHSHFDHVDGLEEIVRRHPATVYAGADRPGRVAATRVGHGDRIRVGALEGVVLATPGHTPDGLSLAFPGAAFTGDALFAGSVGGTAGKADYDRQLEAIRAHLFTLPPDTHLYVGHGPPTTVAIESRYNPFFV